MAGMNNEDLIDSLYVNFMGNFTQDWNLNKFKGFCIRIDIDVSNFLDKYAESISCGDPFRKALICRMLMAVSDSIMDLAKESIRPYFINADHTLSEVEVDEFQRQFMNSFKNDFLAEAQKAQQQA